MSDQDRRTAIPAWQGGRASVHEHDEGLPESVVEIEARLDRLKSELVKDLVAALHQKDAPKERPMLGELIGEWLMVIAPTRVEPGNEQRLARHLRALFLEDEESLTVAHVEDHLSALPLSPSTRNKVRGVGRLAIARAQADKRWHGPNPFQLVRRAREPRREYETLSLEEFAAVQAELRPDRRRLFRVQLHLGLRTGEAFALRKEDVDFAAGSIVIRRSHSRDSTKTGRVRTIPLLPAVSQDLFEACQASKSHLVFPSDDGQIQRFDTKLTRVIRTAMASAGVGIHAVTYKCRWCKSSVTLPPPVNENVCTHCGRLRWPVPLVRPFRWYDLRHAAASLHHRAGADPLAISVLLGHSVRDTTRAIYTHLTLADLHRELGRWALVR